MFGPDRRTDKTLKSSIPSGDHKSELQERWPKPALSQDELLNLDASPLTALLNNEKTSDTIVIDWNDFKPPS